MLTRLQALSDDHFDYSPDEIGWEPCRHPRLLRRAAEAGHRQRLPARASTPSGRSPPPPRAAPAAGARARRRATVLSGDGDDPMTRPGSARPSSRSSVGARERRAARPSRRGPAGSAARQARLALHKAMAWPRSGGLLEGPRRRPGRLSDHPRRPGDDRRRADGRATEGPRGRHGRDAGRCRSRGRGPAPATRATTRRAGKRKAKAKAERQSQPAEGRDGRQAHARAGTKQAR